MRPVPLASEWRKQLLAQALVWSVIDCLHALPIAAGLGTTALDLETKNQRLHYYAILRKTDFIKWELELDG